MKRRLSGTLLALGLAVSMGCGESREPASSPSPTSAPARGAAPAPAVPADGGLTARGLSGRHRDDARWVPGEYKAGRRKWRDAGIYVDGEPRAVIWFGELPAKLKPIWIEQERDLDYRAGELGPRTATFKERRYRIAEYLEAIGVDLRRVQEIHIYGGKGFPAVIAGKELRRVRDDLHFAFGRTTAGKPLLYLPAGIDTNTSFDHISSITVYIDKRPPTLRPDGDLELDGELVFDIPYYGEPLRGGVRVYKDDRLATWIKRRKLEGADALAEQRPDGTLHWQLLPFLEAQGVTTAGVVLADLVYDERRVVRLDRAALEQATFTASPQAGGQILFGGDKPVQAIALHSEPLPLPVDPDTETPR